MKGQSFCSCEGLTKQWIVQLIIFGVVEKYTREDNDEMNLGWAGTHLKNNHFIKKSDYKKFMDVTKARGYNIIIL